jgi:hypothetical protein
MIIAPPGRVVDGSKVNKSSIEECFSCQGQVEGDALGRFIIEIDIKNRDRHKKEEAKICPILLNGE